MTRRYAEFISALHSLNPDNNQIITTRLAALRTQMYKLLQRIAEPLKKVPKLDALHSRHKHSVFLINNFDQILSVLSVSVLIISFI